MAGTGKTTIASTFCDLAERRTLLAASFFCTRSSEECRNVSRIIPTIAYQVARYSMSYKSVLCEVLEQNPDLRSRNVLEQFEQLLKNPLQRVKDTLPDHILIVIDGLDECDDRNGVEEMLNPLFRYAPGIPLKFLVTSRPEPEIYVRLTRHAQLHATVHLHDIDSSPVEADIELYLNEELAFMELEPTQILQLVGQSGSLFIYAATLVRYIRLHRRSTNPQQRLQRILSMTPEAKIWGPQIDELFNAVLKSALNPGELEWDEVDDIRMVLRTVLFAQEPIGVEAVATLAGVDDPERVLRALRSLQFFLRQSAETGLIYTLHASFPGFMFSSERSGEYFLDIVEHSYTLAERCMMIMKEQLRFNICGLESSSVPDEKVDGLQDRIRQKISPTLSYACRYWGSHLALAPKSDDLLLILKEFICDRLLFWTEVLSLREELPTGIEMLLKAKQWLEQAGSASSDLVILVEDARNFVSDFAGSSAAQSTPQLYVSAFNPALGTLKARMEAKGFILSQQLEEFTNQDLITGAMPATKILQNLVAHGCLDISQDLDIVHTTEYPASTGGFGDVYCARLRDGERVALKCVRMLVDSSGEGKKYLKDAAHELYVWSKCKHPNILELFGVTLFRGQIAMVSPWLENGHLRWFLSQNKSADRCDLCAQIAGGVDHLHKQSIVHGDLKPENILISKDHTPKLADFGSAALAEYSLRFAHSDSAPSISLRWTAPEIMKQESKPTQASDVYALGMIIFAAITLLTPYAGANDAAIVLSVVVGKVPTRPEAQIPSGVEQADRLWSLIKKCWSFDPRDRPPAWEVKNVMDEITPLGLLANPS